MEKQTIIALVLIFLIFIISSEFIWKPNQKAHLAAQKEQEELNQTEDIIDPQPIHDSPVIEEPIKFSELFQTDSIEIVSDLILENDKMKITFTNFGGNINSIILKDYAASNKVSQVELVPNQEKLPSIRLFSKNNDSNNLDDVIFTYEQFPEENKLIFQTNIPSGFVKKEFQLTVDYNLNLNFIVENYPELDYYEIGFDSGIADTEEFIKHKKQDYKVFSQIDNEFHSKVLKSLKTKESISELKRMIRDESPDEKNKIKLTKKYEMRGKIDWSAIRSKFFIMVLIPDKIIDLNKIFYYKNKERPAIFLSANVRRTSFEHNYDFYFGPLIYNRLLSYNNGIEHTVEMGPGFLRWLGKFFHKLFYFLHTFIPNWGICLLIFAIIIKLILYPLTHKSFEASTKMQSIQPLVKEIQTKYRHDPVLMNSQTQKLYKEHKVNPLGGCLPMLLQMPIFFALYPVLKYSIDLRQASFLWLTDLSEPDPYLIMPIMMGVFMFLQSFLMQPSKSKMDDLDEKQQAQMQSQKMMTYIMPVFMFFIFKGFPSGLVMYWTVFNVFSILQMFIIRKQSEKKKENNKLTKKEVSA